MVRAGRERLAQAEVVDAVGHGVRLIDVRAWPLTIGRAIDNHVVLPDPHVAAHHASVAPDADGPLRLNVGDSRNGVRVEHGRKRFHLGANEHAILPAGARLHLGHSRLLLRLPHDPVPALVIDPPRQEQFERTVIAQHPSLGIVDEFRRELRKRQLRDISAHAAALALCLKFPFECVGPLRCLFLFRK